MESTVLSIVFHMNQCGIYEFVTQYIDLKEYDEWLKKNKANDDDDNQLQWLLEVLTSNQNIVATASAIAELLALNRAAASAILAEQVLRYINIPVSAVAERSTRGRHGRGTYAL